MNTRYIEALFSIFFSEAIYLFFSLRFFKYSLIMEEKRQEN